MTRFNSAIQTARSAHKSQTRRPQIYIVVILLSSLVTDAMRKRRHSLLACSFGMFGEGHTGLGAETGITSIK